MRKPTMLLPPLVLGIAGVISAATPSFAFPITYTETATMVSGCLGTPSAGSCLTADMFSDATVTLTMTSDTNNVTGGPPSSNWDNVAPAPPSPGAATVSVNGGAAITFTDTIEVFSNQNVMPQIVGFQDMTNTFDILDTVSSSLAGYDLKSMISPISGTAQFNSTKYFPIADGYFNISSVAGSVTFSAPAPLIGRGLPVLLAVGGILLGANLLERRKPRNALR